MTLFIFLQWQQGCQHSQFGNLEDLGGSWRDLGGMLGNVGGILKIAGTQTGSVDNLAATAKNIKSVTFSHPFYVFCSGSKVLNTPSLGSRNFQDPPWGPESTFDPQEKFRMLGASWGNLMLHNRTSISWASRTQSPSDTQTHRQTEDLGELGNFGRQPSCSVTNIMLPP